MTIKFNWEKTNKSTKKFKKLLCDRLNKSYKYMSESKWYFHVWKHNCSICGKQIISKYPTCFNCYGQKKPTVTASNNFAKYSLNAI